MLFNSYGFILGFLPPTVVGYLLLSRHWPGATIYWLAGASLVFYGGWDPRYLPLLVGSALFNYAVGRLIAVNRPNERRAPLLLTAGIAGDLGLLGYFKYMNFFIAVIDDATGVDWSLGAIILPLGISFFTFTQLAFLVDVWGGKASEASLPKYLLFVTFFPHLIAGPILHHAEVMPQFDRKSPDRTADIAVGLTIFVIGLFKKVMLADAVAPYVAPVFDAAAAGHEIGVIEAWCGALAFTLQLYFDFSGYSDMAIGLARMVGVTFPLNFASPYKAPSIIEFWRRWHMTLSRFLRDYLYIPLGGSRRGDVRRYVNLMVTMVLGGAWHGAGWTFIMWGALHGGFLAVNHLWRHLVGVGSSGSRLRRTAGCGLTFLSVTVAWVFFRAPTVEAGFRMLAGMTGQNGLALPVQWEGKLSGLAPLLRELGIGFADFGTRFTGTSELRTLALLLAIVWLLPNTQQVMARFAPALGCRALGAAQLYQWRPTPAWALLMAFITILSVLQLNQVSPFLYYQF